MHKWHEYINKNKDYTTKILKEKSRKLHNDTRSICQEDKTMLNASLPGKSNKNLQC